MKRPSQIAGLLISLGIAFAPLTRANQDKSVVNRFDLWMASRNPETGKQFETVAATSGVKLDVGTFTILNAKHPIALIAALAGVDSVPATRLAKGVAVAFGFFHLPQASHRSHSSLPAGFYTIRIRASQKTIDASFKQNARARRPDPRGVDQHPSITNAQAEFVDSSGRVVAKNLVSLHVLALETPPAGKKKRTTIEPTGGPQNFSFCMRLGAGSYRVCWGNTWIDDVFEAE